MKKIIYIGAFRFPDQDAAAKRVYGIGCILKELGYTVIFAGGQQNRNLNEQTKFRGFSYYSLNELDKKNNSIYGKFFSFLQSGNNSISWLESYLEDNKVDKIIVYNSSYIYLRKIFGFCLKNNIEMLCDVTEWNDSSHLPGGRWGLVSIDNMLKMYFFYNKISKKITISSYLYNYYNGGKKNIIIPPLFTEKINHSPKYINNRINIIYAGNPGKKDSIHLFILAYMNNRQHLPRLSIEILGLTKDDFESLYDIKVYGDIVFYGRVSYNIVLEKYKSAHFSFFARENKRYSNAGFPTKFVESLSQGTPVIANITSDLAEYLIDRENGFILKDLTENAIFETLLEINNITSDSYIRMQNLALVSSDNFYYKKYVDRLGKFLDS